MTARLVCTSRTALAALLACGLGGCISLLPKTPPAQLYAFGRLPPPSASAATIATADQAAIILTDVDLPRASMGDDILTLNGDQAAYIAGSRWVTPAGLMFQSDAEHAFALQAPAVRLLPRGDFSTAKALLHLDVGDFEARYDNGAGAPPTVLVSLQATLSRPDGTLLAQQSFTVSQPASEDRVGAIVDAFDRATKAVLGQVTAWTTAEVPTMLAPEPEPDATSTSSARSSTTVTSRP